MQVLYMLDLTRQEHVVMNGGYVFRFNLSGKFLGASANMLGTSFREVDMISMIQQGNACEVAECIDGKFRKRVATFQAFQSWLQSCPARPIAVLTMKRKIGTETCLHTMYVYNKNTVSKVHGFV